MRIGDPSYFTRSNMLRLFSQYVSPKSLMLIVIESLTIALALICAAKLRFWNDPADFQLYVVYPDFALQTLTVVAVCVICFYCNDLYDVSYSGESAVERILKLEQSLGAASLLLGVVYFLVPRLLLGRGVFLIAMVLAAGFVAVTRRAVDTAWNLTAGVQRTVILGSGELALQLAREIARRGDLPIKMEGFISAGAGAADHVFGIPILGHISEIESIVTRVGVSRIIVALEDRRGVLPVRGLVSLRVQGVRVEDASTALAALTGRIPLNVVRPSWFVFSDGFRRSRSNDLLKRMLDLGASVTGMLLSAPIMVLVAVAVRLDSKGPVIYRQTRVGRMGKCFEVLKFRSMRVDAEQGKAQWAARDDPRVTRVGRFIRKYRLDELPQFWNVIRGDMSFVGPRPERPCFVKELRAVIPYYDERHSVRPGLTGWAQVQYSYGASVEDAANKLEYDLFYLKNMSLIFDFAILFQTVRIVLKGDGAR